MSNYWQKILPNQNSHAHLYAVDDIPIEQSIFELILNVCELPLPEDAFELESPKTPTIKEMASNPLTLGFLQWLVVLKDVRSILEIGGRL